MYVRITLYKTGFTLEDIYVGANSDDRAAGLATLPSFTLPVSSYNPKRPFRIKGNYLEYSRKWDYAKFELSTLEDMSNAQTRYYFIQTFAYVNDEVTDIVCLEDLIGNFWHDIYISRIAPQRYTWAEGEESTPSRGLKKANTDFQNSIYDYTKVWDNRVSVTVNGVQKYIGAIVTIATYTHLARKYEEDHVTYPFEVDLHFFVYDDNNNITNENVYVAGIPIDNADNYSNYFRNSSEGFAVINNYIMYDTADLIRASVTDGKITISSVASNLVSMELMQINLGTASSPEYIRYMVIATNNYRREVSFSVPDSPLAKAPYMIFRVLGTNNKLDLDPIQFGTSVRMFLKKSYIPPLNVVLYATDGLQEDVIEFQALKTFQLGEYPPFGVFKDAYTEWVRTNYNSTITGLAVQQRTEKWILDNNTVGGAGKTALNIGTSLLSAGSSKNGIQGSDVFAALQDAGNFAIDTTLAYGNMELKHKAEQDLLNLKLADIAATPDRVNITGAVALGLAKVSYLSIWRGDAPQMDFYKSYYRAFGYSLPQEITGDTRAHQYFDFIQASDVVISPLGTLKLSQLEQSQLRAQLKEGVRLWYDITRFKKFTTNPVYIGGSSGGGTAYA